MQFTKEQYLQQWNDEIDKKSSNVLNENQKKLIKTIIESISENNIELVEPIIQFLLSRVKTGFTFDVAPQIDNKKISYLEIDTKRSFNVDETKTNFNSLIIGDNIDGLKNLMLSERERETA
ncbi:hypothetical protein VBM89_01605 [Mycoplasma sp. 1199]|uniref:hypothetical protein n=1 Tax=Mycoplasma sp. 1199 TaxID=3108526 RepID=UPI002B1D984E|nr:hypothetical protein [Mycoplasma sp. 1199]MEA4206206.1 hypothetical protein [Mycoplasma sp. 1199]